MARIQVHNISDRPNTDVPAKAYMVAGRKLRPGKSAVVDQSALNSKHNRLHGSALWFGALPPRFAKTSKSALKAKARLEVVTEEQAPMTLAEVREYLNGLRLSEVVELSQKMVPPLPRTRELSKPAIIARMSRVMFRPSMELDPEYFFWTRRWRRTRGGYVLIEE